MQTILHGMKLRLMAKGIVWSFIAALAPLCTGVCQNIGNVSGVVTDAASGQPLPGATVIIVGTSLGASSNLNGRYVIQNVPAGHYRLRAAYIGYKPKSVEVTVSGTANVVADIKLSAVGVRAKGVTVTSQASGQNEAINQQISSIQITNVVSAARIRELPDANAAESVGRLPGVSVLRSGGEGNEVVIRGLAPKYNEIEINGVELASSSPNNRSVDLSMISSNMLEGIQVSKTVTPDMDANVIGGVVNFQLREARTSKRGGPEYHLLVQGGYNNLPDATNKLNNYKYVASAEDRWLNNRFGVLAEIEAERRNLTSNELGATYDHLGSSTTQYTTTTLNLSDIPRDRRRYDGTIVMDYVLPQGSIKFSNFLATGQTAVQDRGETFDIANNQHDYSLGYSNSRLSIIDNSIEFRQRLPIFNVDATFSHVYTETRNPNNWTVSFLQTSAGLDQFVGQTNVNPRSIPPAANDNLASTILNNFITNSSFARERDLTGNLNLGKSVNFSNMVRAYIKIGGEYRYLTRSYAVTQFGGDGLALASATYVDSLICSPFSSARKYIGSTVVPITAFVDPNFSYGTFLNGQYSMNAPISYGMMAQAATILEKDAALIAQNDAISYARDNVQSTTNNYSGHENQDAFYAMATIDIGPQIVLIPGVRYQNLRTTYTAPRGIEPALTDYPYNHYDTTVTMNHGYWLPDVAFRYKPLSWFDVRLSYTHTLAYPDFNSITPRIDVSNGYIQYNNYTLIPSRSTNYDAYFSAYDNTIGLFTVGVFNKEITDLIYPWSFHVGLDQALKYYPPQLIGTTTPFVSPTIATFINDSSTIDEWGMELDWETHFWYLPDPFSGLLLDVNYTHIYANAHYPYVSYVKPGYHTLPTAVDTSFVSPLLYQPDDIVNLSVGYDYLGFSARISLLYQAKIFTGPNFWPQLRTNTSAYTRWDLAVNQNLPWRGLQLYAELNNINGENDISVIQAAAGVPASEQDYGMTVDVGLRLKL